MQFFLFVRGVSVQFFFFYLSAVDACSFVLFYLSLRCVWSSFIWARCVRTVLFYLSVRCVCITHAYSHPHTHTHPPPTQLVITCTDTCSHAPQHTRTHTQLTPTNTHTCATCSPSTPSISVAHQWSPDPTCWSRQYFGTSRAMFVGRV